MDDTEPCTLCSFSFRLLIKMRQYHVYGWNEIHTAGKPSERGGFLLLRRFVQRRKDEMFCTFLTNKFVFSIKNCLTFAKT